MKDAFGVEIVVGDRVAYPGRSGSNLWLNTGVVTGLTDGENNKGTIQVKFSDGRTGWTGRIDRVVVCR